VRISPLNSQAQRDFASTHPVGGLADIDNFIQRGLAGAHSDSDRVHVYQSAFDLLTQEFQLVRPLLERIKQHYDAMGRDLLAKKRVVMTDNTSVSSAEDTFSENVNRMRRARAQEFTQRRAEIDKLLDEMTDLRVHRSDLQHQLEQLDTQKAELKLSEEVHASRMAFATARVTQLMDEIKQMELDTAQTRQELVVIDEKVEKTIVSSLDLTKSDLLIEKEMNELQAIETKLKQELVEIDQEDQLIETQLEEVRRDVRALTKENNDAIEKAKSITERRQATEARIREMLAPYERAPKLPLAALIHKFVAKRRQAPA
jgi:chromosome segregation ATPase